MFYYVILKVPFKVQQFHITIQLGQSSQRLGFPVPVPLRKTDVEGTYGDCVRLGRGRGGELHDSGVGME